MARKRLTTGLPGRARTYTAKEEAVTAAPLLITKDFYVSDELMCDFLLDVDWTKDFYIHDIEKKDFIL